MPPTVNRWTVCALLLLATMLNYMDRQALVQTSKRVVDEFKLDAGQYGSLESAFGFGFALGAVAAVLLTLWSVHRCQHLGWSRWCCLLFLVPLANLGLLLLLLIKPDAKPGAAA